jgi:hypothetical protein
VASCWSGGKSWRPPRRKGGRLVALVPLYIYDKPGSALGEVFQLGIATTDCLDGLFEAPFAR